MGVAVVGCGVLFVLHGGSLTFCITITQPVLPLEVRKEPTQCQKFETSKRELQSKYRANKLVVKYK